MISGAELVVARRLYYSLFSRLFTFNYDDGRFKGVSKMISLISTAALNDQSYEALNRLNASFTDKNPQNLIEEYDDIFNTPNKPLPNSISFYDEGYDTGRACVRVRKILAQTDIRRDESKFKENEDSVGFIFTLMSEFLAKQESGDGLYEELAKELFETVLNENIDEFIQKLFMHESSDMYKDIAIVLQNFIEFERSIYGLSKPAKKTDNKKAYDGILRSEMIRREKNRVRKFKTVKEIS